MTNFAQGAARPRHDLVRRATIEAIGEYGGLWSFYDRTPSYLTAPELALCKPWLVKGSLPRKFPEAGNPLGGADAGGELNFSITDGLGSRAGGSYNAITALLGIDAPPDFELTNAGGILGSTTTGITIEGIASKIAQVTALSTVLFFGAEAWTIDAITASTATTLTLDVTRATLDTERQAHEERAGGYLFVPFIGGRRVRVYVGFDIPTFSQAEESEQSPGWRIDGDGMSEGLGAYEFRAASSLSTINREVYRKYYTGTISTIEGDADTTGLVLSVTDDVYAGHLPNNADHFGDGGFYKHGNEEIFEARTSGSLRLEHLSLIRSGRAKCGTKRTNFEIDETVQQVFCAWGAEGRSSFGFQEPGGETISRASGSWIRGIRAEHPVPIALGLILSSATPNNADGLECTNWVSGSGNFSALPPGAGAGIPISEVDYESAHRLWFRTLDWRIPYFRLDQSESLRECLEREILRLTGILLTTRNGKIYFDLPSSPVVGATGVSFAPTDILTKKTRPGFEESRLSDRSASELGAPTVKFLARKPGGGEYPIIINDADYPQLTGFIRSKFGLDSGSIEIPARGVPVDRAGASKLLEQVALRHLVRFRRPPREHVFVTDFSFIDQGDIGTQALLSHPDLVDRRNRARGVTNLVIWIRSKVPDNVIGEIEWKALSFAIAGRFTLNPPSAIITNVVGNVATCRTNRYTDATVPASLALPARDVDAFNQTDVCILRDRAGAIVSGVSTQTISSIASGSDQITFNGNFGAALAIGRVITWAAYDLCTALQRLSYSFFADSVTLGLGVAEATASNWGER